MRLSDAQRSALLELARAAVVRALVGEGAPPPPPLLAPPADPDLLQPAGCFVTLHEIATRRLRGCIGRIDAHQPLYLAVHCMAESVLEDPRFTADPVTLAELARLEIEVTVLSPLIDAIEPLDFDPIEHGVYLTIGERTGCFLPQVARETGWTREQLLDRLASEKLNLAPGAWRTPLAKLQRFTALIIGPEPFHSPARTGGNEARAC